MYDLRSVRAKEKEKKEKKEKEKKVSWVEFVSSEYLYIYERKTNTQTRAKCV